MYLAHKNIPIFVHSVSGLRDVCL